MNPEDKITSIVRSIEDFKAFKINTQCQVGK